MSVHLFQQNDVANDVFYSISFLSLDSGDMLRANVYKTALLDTGLFSSVCTREGLGAYQHLMVLSLLVSR